MRDQVFKKIHESIKRCCKLYSNNHFEGLSERFELFANKLEIVNAYTELNDPIKQREMFDLQRRDGEQESENLENEAYITALEHGLPPTAGWGLGVDRLVMLVTGQTNIRQVNILVSSFILASLFTFIIFNSRSSRFPLFDLLHRRKIVGLDTRPYFKEIKVATLIDRFMWHSNRFKGMTC